MRASPSPPACPLDVHHPGGQIGVGNETPVTVMRQDEVGRCSFIDVLEEAVLRARPVGLRLRDGTTFIDRVVDVVTEAGDDFAVFRFHPRVPVGRIAAVTRADLGRGVYAGL